MWVCKGVSTAPRAGSTATDPEGIIMSHKNKKSLVKQINDVLTAKMSAGRSKHEDKQAKDTAEHIYSYETLRGYMKQANYFAKYCKERHKAKTLEDCKRYINEFLQYDIDRGMSACTVKLRAAALAKLYSCSTKDFIRTPARKRADITRSRKKCVRDRHVSEKNNAQLITFLKATGLRRREVRALTGDCFVYHEGRPCVYVRNGKGGRKRYAPIIDHADEIEALMRGKGKAKVFDKIPTCMDVHGYRSIYATKIYKMYERPLDQLTKKEKYYCRNDKKGTVYDRKAMLRVSESLGHGRVSIIAEHYLNL